MIERLFILAALAVVIGCAALAARAVARSRVASRPPAELWRALETAPDGRPAIVAFSGPRCADCRAQKAILRGLEGVRTIEIDTAARPAVAQAFGVLTVPTTVVLDAEGRVAAVNLGLTQVERLRAQLTGRFKESAA